MAHFSPLRYPGGKTSLYPFFRELLIQHDLRDGVYYEPFAGGAGLALKLLFKGDVSEIKLNDLSPSIFSFWKVLLKEPDYLLDFVDCCPLTIEFYRKQREIVRNPRSFGRNALAAAVLYLNRTNRSGILEGGPIGGYAQMGQWTLGCRFNRTSLSKKIRLIADHREQITINNFDAITFIRKKFQNASRVQKHFAYLDPPYFAKSEKLYLNCYTERDHQHLAAFLDTIKNARWLLSYDNHPYLRSLYAGYSIFELQVMHSAGKCHKGDEIFIPSEKISLCNALKTFQENSH